MSRKEFPVGGSGVVVLVTVVAVVGVIAPAAAAVPLGGHGGSTVEDAAGATSAGSSATNGGTVPGRIAVPDGIGGMPTAPGQASGPSAATPARTMGPASGPPPGRGFENATVTNVTLVTGQRVTVFESGTETSYVVDADAAMRRVETPRGTYVYPAGTDFGTFDPQLFNVDLLVDQGLTDEESGAIPVIVERERSPGTVETQRSARGALRGFEAERSLDSIDAVAGTIDKASARSNPTVATQRSTPAVERVHLDRYYEVDLDDSTEAIGADAARAELDVDGSGVRVAVLDTGVSDTHPDLDDGTVVDERDFTGDGTVEDEFGHGTHVASILAGDGDASDGEYTGVAPGAEVMNLKVLDADGRGRASWIIAGMEYAVANSADVVSMSLGVRPSGETPIAEAANEATEQGAVVVLSAGNSGPQPGTIGTPGIARRAITVGAVDHTTGEVARFSSRGPTAFTKYVKPDVVAPGVAITAACARGAVVECSPENPDYASFDGTSMSAPHVSGVVALMLEANPDWSPARVKNALLSTATSTDPAEYTVYDDGAGFVNATRAVDPGVVVENASLDVGVVDENRTVTRVVTLRNLGEEVRTLDVAATVRDAATGESAADVSLNRTEVAVPAGGSADVRLSIDATVPEGVYSGRLTVSGQDRTYSAAIGFTRARTITVEKRPIPGTSVEGDRVWVIPQSRGVTARLLEISNGTAEFVAQGADNYTLLSAGTDESTGTPVLMLSTVERPERILIDEGETVVYDLDASELRDRHGRLVNLSTQAELRAGPFFGLTALENFTDARRVRFSEQPYLGAIVEHVLAPASEHDGESRHVDVDSLYHLVHSTPTVNGSETFAVDRSELGVENRTYYRSAPDQRLQLTHRILLPGRFTDDGYWWNLSGRTGQSVYVTAENASLYGIVRAPDRRGGESPWLLSYRDPGPGETVRTAYNRHPYTSLAAWDLDGVIDADWFFQVDQGPGRTIYSDPATDSETTVRINGSVVYADASGYASGAYTAARAPSGTVVEVTLETTKPDGLSTRTVGHYRATLSGDDRRPPGVESLVFEAMNHTSAVPAGESTVRVNFSEAGRVAEAVVLYAAGDGPAVPVSADGVEAGSGWTRAETTRINDTAFRATINATSRHTSVAVYGVDGAGNAVATTVYDAVRTPGADEAGPSLADYANDEGVVGTDGLRAAIGDWARGDVTLEFLRQVIRAWATGQPID